jgi:hypothetical protein
MLKLLKISNEPLITHKTCWNSNLDEYFHKQLESHESPFAVQGRNL